MGQTADKIFVAVKNEAEKQGKKINITMAENLEDAVRLAKKVANPRWSSAVLASKCKLWYVQKLRRKRKQVQRSSK